MQERLFRLRVTYKMTGRLSYLSHLEVARALERVVRRAGLPFAVTCGFSPHMRISFGPALPVGIGGDSEIFDVYLTEYIPPAIALEMLQEKSPNDLMPIACSYVENTDAAASVAFPVSIYEVELPKSVHRVGHPDALIVHKKKGDKEMMVADYLKGGIDVSDGKATFALEQLATGSLRPDVLLGKCSFFDADGNLVEVSALKVRRVSLESSI